MGWTPEVISSILNHTSADSAEVCGFVLSCSNEQTYCPCRNVSAVPADSFEISADDWIKAEEKGDVIAIVHSHPRGEPYLSGADRLAQNQSGLPWLLAVSGQVKHFRFAPLLRGRSFNYGNMDCYTLARDAFMLMGVEFRDHPRTDIDKDVQLNSFVCNLPDGGFYRVRQDELKEGDVILTAYCNAPNHIALYLGQGEILHHALDQMSRREPYRSGLQRITHSVWRHSHWKDGMIQAVKNDLENLM